MWYQSELHFLENILENMHLHVSLLQEPYENAEIHYVNYIKNFCSSCQEKIIYKAYDEFLFNYLILRLPEPGNCCLLVGPYTLVPWDTHMILDKAQEFHISPEIYPHFRDCYNKVPLVTDSSMLFTLINTFAATLWGSMDAFSIKELHNLEPIHETEEKYAYSSDELFHSMDQIEQKYNSENEFLQIVSHGQLHKIEMYVNLINIKGTELRLADRVRNAKNYAIIMNTLLRKAAENGAVHPVHIDHLSSHYARKIELQTSENGITLLVKEMARKYTLLVRNHSLKGYSTLVRKVLVHIDTDLAADLSLSAQAELLNVNPSYLSTVFKKETGHTLTEYVTGKRIEHAVFLLNSTNMQIQTIAQYCGIPDICYFTKTFKKLIGKTPTEYKNSILH